MSLECNNEEMKEMVDFVQNFHTNIDSLVKSPEECFLGMMMHLIILLNLFKLSTQ